MAQEETVSVDHVDTVAPVVAPVTVERLADQDKALLELAKTKLSLAMANVDNAKLQYENTTLQLAIKYHLHFGDVITEGGEIQRNSKDS